MDIGQLSFSTIMKAQVNRKMVGSLVSATRQLDNATAELMEAPRERIDLSALVASISGSL